jgi:uncharacterized RDD family membrane protein YckC
MIIDNSSSDIEINMQQNSAEFEAAIFRRIFAFLTDNIILTAAGLSFVIIFQINLFDLLSNVDGFLVFMSAIILFHQIYFLIIEALWTGNTLGKRIFKIKVIKNNGANPDLLISFVRNFSRSIYFLPPFFFLPDIICLFLTAFKKRIGDILAGTLIIKLQK